jgi:hypothetical protein
MQFIDGKRNQGDAAFRIEVGLKINRVWVTVGPSQTNYFGVSDREPVDGGPKNLGLCVVLCHSGFIKTPERKPNK